ncbi:MAG: N-acetylmuramoyl-L-alanine amidase [Candidatus Omnitrophica bacterium]|nr:N-acetylmuramoyl-L-alanine amidase [Candidatus Omnitrophota bacterium]
MKRILVICALIFTAGCGTTSTLKTYKEPPAASQFVEIKKFCTQYGMKYSFDTIDDIVRLGSEKHEIRLLLNSLIVYFNGTTFYLDEAPYYKDGKIYVPAGLVEIISKKTPRRELPIMQIKTIVIDPGHGGKDPGAISRQGLKEKDVNLAVAKILQEELQEMGFTVYLTRSTDVYLSLRQRVQVASIKKADLFISIHANSNKNRKVNGVEVYYLAPKYFDDEAKVVALTENASLDFSGEFSQRTKAILWDLISTENNALSVEYANVLVNMFKRLGFKVKQARGAPFYVLKYASVPSVLLETAYLSNYYEEKLLRSAQYRKQISQAVALGVKQFNSRYAKISEK